MANIKKQGNRGGVRVAGPGKKLGRTPNDEKGLSTARRVNIRLYDEDLDNAEELINLGYGKDRSDVVRRALRDALERLSA